MNTAGRPRVNPQPTNGGSQTRLIFLWELRERFSDLAMQDYFVQNLLSPLQAELFEGFFCVHPCFRIQLDLFKSLSTLDDVHKVF